MTHAHRRLSPLTKVRTLLMAAVLCFLLCAEGKSQARFIQLTDPHIFDDKSQEARDEDRAALSAAVEKINERVAQGANYDFVVITGDLGVEALIVAEKLNQNGQVRAVVDEARTSENLARGAQELADILKLSNVRRWLFVAGNNDLYDEQTETVNYYNRFLELLSNKLGDKEIIDLNRVGGERVYRANGFAFVGFNDASFKNQGDPARLGRAFDDQKGECVERDAATHEWQLREAEAVAEAVADLSKQEQMRAVFIFHHEPELDDPYLIALRPGNPDYKEKVEPRLKNRSCVGEGNVYSSWFVNEDVRQAWGRAVQSEKVRGIFAGHLHDSRRSTYASFHWLRTPGYSSGSLSKLYLCPPLAIKLQPGEGEQARGFLEVSIDRDGEVADGVGAPGARTFWYDQATRTFSTDFDDIKEAEAIRQIKLGQMLEDAGRLKDAEAAYTSALATDSPVTRSRASAALSRAVARQSSPWNRYLLSAWPLSPEGALLLTALLGMLLMLAVLLFDLDSFARRRRGLPAVWTAALVACVTLLFCMMLWIGNRSFLLRWKASLSPGVCFLLAACCLLVALLALWKVLEIRGRNKLMVAPLVDITEHKLGGTFPHVVAQVREVMRGVRNDEFVPDDSPLAVIGEETEFPEFVESLVGGTWGKVIGWVVRRSSRPEYMLRGTLQTSGTNLTIAVSLESRGRFMEAWPPKTFAAGELFAREQELAHDVLRYLGV